MKASNLLPALVLYTATATAAGIDMDDPRRALGREGDVRIDAQLARDSVSPGVPIGFTYQIQNFSAASVAIAHKVTDSSYDDETGTITIVVGAEVPPDGDLPAMTVIGPGEKVILHGAVAPILSATAMRQGRGRTARLVQLKVAILRGVEAFLPLIARQEVRARQSLSDEQFDRWLDGNDTIFLNAVPVYFTPQRNSGAETREARGRF